MVNRPRGTLGTTKTRRKKGTLARALWGYRVRPPLCLIVVREEKEGKPVHSIRVANAKRPLLQGRYARPSECARIVAYAYIYIYREKKGRKEKEILRPFFCFEHFFFFYLLFLLC